MTPAARGAKRCHIVCSKQDDLVSASASAHSESLHCVRCLSVIKAARGRPSLCTSIIVSQCKINISATGYRSATIYVPKNSFTDIEAYCCTHSVHAAHFVLANTRQYLVKVLFADVQQHYYARFHCMQCAAVQPVSYHLVPFKHHACTTM